MIEELTGVERAVFGPVTRGDVDRWLDRHVRTRLSDDVADALFRSGRIAAVYCLRLAGGAEVVVKVHRAAGIERLAAAVTCQRRLADSGYPCPVPLDGPAVTDGHVAVLETRLERGELGDAHRPEIRRALARALWAQVDLLRPLPPEAAALTDPPAWAEHAGGPWPVPHDPFFDFTTTPDGYAWLDRLAALATRALGAPQAPDAVAHGDWACQNARFSGGEVVAGYDWDSLLAAPEPVLAGVAAASYLQGSTAGTAAPAPAEVAAFLADYDACRHRPCTGAAQAAAAAAATWTLAYNARCELSARDKGFPVQEGGSLDMLRHGTDHLAVRW